MYKLIRTRMFVLLTFIVVMELLTLTASAKDQDLSYVHANQDGTWYINARAEVHPVGGKASFWSTLVPEKDGAYYDVLGMSLEKRGKNRGQLEYVQLLQEVDCSMWTINTSNVLFYDKQDRIVLEVNSQNSAQLIAEFGQAENSLLTAVCSQHVASLTGEQAMEK
jgi:hypothetical protein